MTFYAGKLILHPEALCRLRVSDAYSIHRLVMDLYEPSRTEAEQKAGHAQSGIQWVDRGEHLYGREILLMSDREPKGMSLPSDVQLAWKPIPDKFFSYHRYRFSIVVNPVVCRDGKRCPIYGEENIQEWFLRRTLDKGFDVQRINVGRVQTESFIKDRKRIVFASAYIDGILQVNNRDLFIKTLTSGIGKGRAFGFGFLQVSPID